MLNDIRKFLKTHEITQINIPNKNKFLIESENIKFFKSKNALEQLNEIKKIKDQYDLCIVSSWTTARLAYLSGLKYIVYFVGNDIRIPPFIKNSKPYYFDLPVNNLNLIQRYFYKKVLDDATICVASSKETFEHLEKFRKDSIRLDRIIVNTDLFNVKIEPLEAEKNQFTFFCPQRIGLEKGTDILWKSIELCKSNFQVLQVDWYDETSPESFKKSQEFLEFKPAKVKLIPKIDRKEIPKYFEYADAILGEMQLGILNNIEREAVLCNKPVICYYDTNMKYIIDGKEIEAPFFPRSKNINEIASLIDRVVTSKEFREELTKNEIKFIRELCDPNKAADEWSKIFLKTYDMKKNSISKFSLTIRKFLFIISHKLFSKESKISLP